MENYKYLVFFFFVFIYGLISQKIHIFFYKKRISSIVNNTIDIEKQEVYLLPFKAKKNALLTKLSELNKKFDQNVCVSLDFNFSTYAFAMYNPGKSLILIGDKLFEDLSIDELFIILSHEFYHIKEKHSEVSNKRVYLILNLSNLLFLIGFGCILLFFKIELLMYTLSFGLAIPEYLVISFVFVLFHAIFNLIMTNVVLPAIRNKFGRFHELEADLFSAQTIGFDSYLKFNKNFKDEFKDIEQISKIGWIFQTHPSWDERLDFVASKMKKSQ